MTPIIFTADTDQHTPSSIVLHWCTSTLAEQNQFWEAKATLKKEHWCLHVCGNPTSLTDTLNMGPLQFWTNSHGVGGTSPEQSDWWVFPDVPQQSEQTPLRTLKLETRKTCKGLNSMLSMSMLCDNCRTASYCFKADFCFSSSSSSYQMQVHSDETQQLSGDSELFSSLQAR